MFLISFRQGGKQAAGIWRGVDGKGRGNYVVGTTTSPCTPINTGLKAAIFSKRPDLCTLEKSYNSFQETPKPHLGGSNQCSL